VPGLTLRDRATRMAPVTVPVGRYAVVVRAPTCQSWSDTVDVMTPNELFQRRVPLLCPPEDQR